MFYFNETIKKRMKRAEIYSQLTLANLAGVSEGSVSKIMNANGCDSVNLKTLAKLAGVLKCNVWQLVKEASK